MRNFFKPSLSLIFSFHQLVFSSSMPLPRRAQRVSALAGVLVDLLGLRWRNRDQSLGLHQNFLFSFCSGVGACERRRGGVRALHVHGRRGHVLRILPTQRAQLHRPGEHKENIDFHKFLHITKRVASTDADGAPRSFDATLLTVWCALSALADAAPRPAHRCSRYKKQ